MQYLRLVSNTCPTLDATHLHTACASLCGTDFLQVSARLFLCTLVKQLTRIGLRLLTPEGVEGAGGGMETYCCADSRWFPRETAGSDGISYGSRSHRICAVGSQTLPCQGASPCTDALVPLLWLTCSAARKVVFILIIMRCDQGKVAEARVHRRCMKTVEPLSFTHTLVVEHVIQNTRAAA